MSDNHKRVALIDDDLAFAKMLESFLQRNSFSVSRFGTAEAALEELSKTTFDLILTDYRMPGMDGLELIKSMPAANADVPLIVLTSYGDIASAVRTMKAGAFDYVTKPVNPDELLALMQNSLKRQAPPKPSPVEKATSAKAKGYKTISTDEHFVAGKSAQTKMLLEHVALVGPTNMSVLIQGESGTGKEYIARKIHESSKRASGPFVAIDCGALSKDLAASELFGHKKGSFTGALSDKAGQMAHADGGTLFLDEIGNLSYEVQVKLLRALQEKVIRPLGGAEDVQVDVRIIAATNENLRSAIQNNQFREDLYHRLNEFKLELSPLRSRPEEIEQFANYFLQIARAELEREVTGFSEAYMSALRQYPWPGNLRELKNVVRRSVLLSPGDQVEVSALPGEILHNQTPTVHSSSTDLKALESDLEKQKIVEALEKVRYNKSKAAKLLNIDRKTLYNKLKLYDLDV